TWNPEPFMPPPVVPRLVLDASAAGSDETALWNIVSQIYNIEHDDVRLRSLRDAEPARRAEHFEQLRRTYPIRREFRYTRVVLKHAGKSLAAAVAALGFKAG
ncbi:MAG: DUF3410 domain-containing protein, partial [bacterium]